MPKVTIERIMTGVSKVAVWKIAKNICDYPRFMDQVLSVQWCDVGEGRVGTSWTVLFNGNELRWIEEDQFFDDEHRMTFTQIEGDLAMWRGSFTAHEERRQTITKYEIEFDLGIPALADLLHPLGERAIQANCQRMLEEMERRSVREAADIVNG